MRKQSHKVAVSFFYKRNMMYLESKTSNEIVARSHIFKSSKQAIQQEFLLSPTRCP